VLSHGVGANGDRRAWDAAVTGTAGAVASGRKRSRNSDPFSAMPAQGGSRILAVFDDKNRPMLAVLLRKEAVSHAMDRQEVTGSARLLLQLVTQPHHVSVNRAGVRIGFVSPD
jgi:hypothetical protein